MWFVIGLGNPGDEYVGSRHNVGRDFVMGFSHKHSFPNFELDKKRSALVSEGKIGKNKTTLILPETYMNKSGTTAKKFVTSKKKASNLIVVQDDIDLSLGKIKVVKGRGSGGHKGIESIKRSIGTNDFIRIRVGISKATSKGKVKKPANEEAVKRFVLGSFTSGESKEVIRVRKKTIEIVESLVKDGLVTTQNKFN